MVLLKRPSASSLRSRRERFLRYMLRRKQCYILLFVEVILLTLLVLCLVTFFWFLRDEMQKVEAAEIENSWKKAEQYKLNFYKCEYAPIWENPDELNRELCKDHFGKGAQLWVMQESLTESKECLHKMHMVPCHDHLLNGPDADIYNQERVAPVSCGGVFGAPLPYEYVTPESDIRAPQISNEMLANQFMNKNIIASALHVKCPRCLALSSWYASPKALQCRRQLHTLRNGWPYIAKYCDQEEEAELNLDKMIYC